MCLKNVTSTVVLLRFTQTLSAKYLYFVENFSLRCKSSVHKFCIFGAITKVREISTEWQNHLVFPYCALWFIKRKKDTSSTIKYKTKTNRDLVARIFPRLTLHLRRVLVGSMSYLRSLRLDWHPMLRCYCQLGALFVTWYTTRKLNLLSIHSFNKIVKITGKKANYLVPLKTLSCLKRGIPTKMDRLSPVYSVVVSSLPLYHSPAKVAGIKTSSNQFHSWELFLICEQNS